MCKNLSLNPTTSNIPVLFLSAKQELSTRIAGLSAGAIDYIVKPFNEGELLLKTFNFLRMQQLRQIKILAGTLNNENNNVADEEIIDCGFVYSDTNQTPTRDDSMVTIGHSKRFRFQQIYSDSQTQVAHRQVANRNSI